MIGQAVSYYRIPRDSVRDRDFRAFGCYHPSSVDNFLGHTSVPE